MAGEGSIPPPIEPPLELDFNVDGEQLATHFYASSGRTLRRASDNYEIYYTSLNTGIGSGGLLPVSVWINEEKTQYKQGFRIDISDVRTVLNVGDTLTIDGVEYTVQRKFTPNIDPVNAKYVAFKNIADTPLETSPDTFRIYRFDISININELT